VQVRPPIAGAPSQRETVRRCARRTGETFDLCGALIFWSQAGRSAAYGIAISTLCTRRDACRGRRFRYEQRARAGNGKRAGILAQPGAAAGAECNGGRLRQLRKL
jgi:hypothetical protein